MAKVTEGDRPAGEVTQGEWPAAKGVVCRFKLYGGTNFLFSGKAAKYKLRGASKLCAPHLPLGRSPFPLSHIARRALLLSHYVAAPIHVDENPTVNQLYKPQFELVRRQSYAHYL